jgi:hypothetical protein
VVQLLSSSEGKLGLVGSCGVLQVVSPLVSPLSISCENVLPYSETGSLGASNPRRVAYPVVPAAVPLLPWRLPATLSIKHYCGVLELQ